MEQRNDRKRIKKKPKRFSQHMRSTLFVIFLIVIAALLFLIFRIAKLNYEKGEKYSKRVLAQQTFTSSRIPYRRGDIVDRNDTVLATSVKVYNLILDVKRLLQYEDSIDLTLESINTYFDIPMSELKEKMETRKESSYVILKKEIDSEVYEAFSEYMSEKNSSKKEPKIIGVWFEEEYKRIYPNDSLASMVVGFTYGAGIGAYGLEREYHEQLIGKDGLSYGYFNNELNLERVNKSAENGNTVVTTLDATVQKRVEEKIKEFTKEYKAKKVSVLVMNPKNGGIYAMATDTQYNLNEPQNLDGLYTKKEQKAMSDEEREKALFDMWKNSIITDIFEPGSTFKPFTIAGALEENVIDYDDTFICNGFEMVDGSKIKCMHNHGPLTLTEVVMYSCNSALMQIGLKMKAANFFKYQTAFQFGSKTNIDLPGEGTGLIVPKDKITNIDLAPSSFGQTEEVTMIQLASAFCSLVNGGNYYEPHVMQRIESESGAIVDKNDGILVRQTVSSETSDFIKAALYETVEAGTAKNAKIDGYAIGGKTGTAQKHPRDANTFVLSFIGAVPIDDPEVVIYVTLDEIEGQRYKDSTLAVSFAGEILKDILPFLGVFPEGEIDYSIWGVDPKKLTDKDHFKEDPSNPGESDFLDDSIPSSQKTSVDTDDEEKQPDIDMDLLNQEAEASGQDSSED